MPQAIKIGHSVFQIDDGALGSAIDQQISRYDSLVEDYETLKLKLDAAEVANATITAQLSEAQTSLADMTTQKAKSDAEAIALQTKLDAANKEFADKMKEKEKAEESDEDAEANKKKPKLDSDEVKSYCKEFLTVINEVTPALKKVDSSFEPDFGLSPLDYKAQYLKTLETLPAEAKARIDSTGSDRDVFVDSLYFALKPQLSNTVPTTKADEGTQTLAESIEKNRSLTVDGRDKPLGITPREDSPTMKARKERALPSAYRNSK